MLGAFTSEIEYLRNDFHVGPTTRTAAGLWISTVWALTPAYQLVGRYESYDPNLDRSADATTSFTIGGNYLIRGEDLMLSLNYLFGDSPLGHEGRLLSRLQIVF